MNRQELTERAWPQPLEMDDEWLSEEPEALLWKDVAVASGLAILLGVVLLLML
jgi:hypothetical protein